MGNREAGRQGVYTSRRGLGVGREVGGVGIPSAELKNNIIGISRPVNRLISLIKVKLRKCPFYFLKMLIHSFN